MRSQNPPLSFFRREGNSLEPGRPIPTPAGESTCVVAELAANYENLRIVFRVHRRHQVKSRFTFSLMTEMTCSVRELSLGCKSSRLFRAESQQRLARRARYGVLQDRTSPNFRAFKIIVRLFSHVHSA